MDKAFRLKNNMVKMVFVFPVLCLLGFVGFNEYHLLTSRELVLPIEGFDPRDFLSGHFLRYRIQYALKCPAAVKSIRQKAYMCFEPEAYVATLKPLANCSLFIKGFCVGGAFQVRTYHRYYIPEKKAPGLEQIFLKAKEKNVVLSVTKKGHILAKDILIEGQSLKSLIK